MVDKSCNRDVSSAIASALQAGSALPRPVKKPAGGPSPAPNSCCGGDGGRGGGGGGGSRRCCCCCRGGTGRCCSSGGACVVSLLAAAGRGSGRPGAKGFGSGAQNTALSTPEPALSTTIGARPPASWKPAGSGGPRVDRSSISIGTAAPKASSRLAEIAALTAPSSTCAMSMSSSIEGALTI